MAIEIYHRINMSIIDKDSIDETTLKIKSRANYIFLKSITILYRLLNRLPEMAHVQYQLIQDKFDLIRHNNSTNEVNIQSIKNMPLKQLRLSSATRYSTRQWPNKRHNKM